MASNYIIQKTESSFCPYCNKLVFLMCDKDGKTTPSFYICWSCEHIAEIGKGPVQEEEQIKTRKEKGL